MTRSIPWNELKVKLKGDLYTTEVYRQMYATDASIYRHLPLAVALPAEELDVQEIVRFCDTYEISITARTAGTSLAGQAVGTGIVVDFSRHMNQVLEYNIPDKWVRVQPGVIRDDLNQILKPFGLHFGPNTSTSNRCMIGGMVGNNSCGSTSIVYGTTRDHVLSIRAVLSDGSLAEFTNQDISTIGKTISSESFATHLEKKVLDLVQQHENADIIRTAFPKTQVTRRNTGYALDAMLNDIEREKFNLCKLLTGSEGTLALTVEIKLDLNPLPPSEVVLLTPHFDTLDKTLLAVQIAMRYQIYACELMDDVILSCTESVPKYAKIREFIRGNPKAVLMIECRADSLEQAKKQAEEIQNEIDQASLSYDSVFLVGKEANKAWDLRVAGLGLLSNIPGDDMPVACIEDTAVAVADLPAYIDEFEQIMQKYNQQSVYYAHAGAGELHIRPILNLKTEEGRDLLFKISDASAELVKKYSGSLSGEHGDGIVRAGFIEKVMGQDAVLLFRQIKAEFDPKGIFNKGKILDAWPISQHLRYQNSNIAARKFETKFDFGNGGILEMAERCNGAGVCRKTSVSGGTMCPSYMATRDEKDSTRARANVLREVLIDPDFAGNFDLEPLKEVMDLCLSCKGCSGECPSNVDLAILKSEVEYQLIKEGKSKPRSWLFASSYKYDKYRTGLLSNLQRQFQSISFLNSWMNRIAGVHPKRKIPTVYKSGFWSWYRKYRKNKNSSQQSRRKIYLFIDEFCAYLDANVAISAVKVMEKLGYEVEPVNGVSGRTYISKGYLDHAEILARQNTEACLGKISKENPLIGLEPSAILTFKDEYPKLLRDEAKQAATLLAESVYLFDEFLEEELAGGNLEFPKTNLSEHRVQIHGHCHQKALGKANSTEKLLSNFENVVPLQIPSGCCGMAGSFGYEKEHYDLSMRVGELVLFPSIRKAPKNDLIIANGTSCRHQILDGTGRNAYHLAEVLDLWL